MIKLDFLSSKPKIILRLLLVAGFVILLSLVAIFIFVWKKVFGPLATDPELQKNFFIFASFWIINLIIYLIIKFIIKKNEVSLISFAMIGFSLLLILNGSFGLLEIGIINKLMSPGWSIFWGYQYFLLNSFVPFFLFMGKK